MKYISECAICQRRLRLYYAVDPKTGMPTWVCQRCERQWARIRRRALVEV